MSGSAAVATTIFGLAMVATLAIGVLSARGRDKGMAEWSVSSRGLGVLFIWLLMAGEAYTSFSFLGTAGWSYSYGVPILYLVAYLTVVAVGGGHQGHRLLRAPAARTLGQGPVDRPGRAERLERRQPQAVRLVLDEDPADPQLRGQGREFPQRGGRVVGQRAVEVPYLGGHGRTPPGAGAGAGEPRQRTGRGSVVGHPARIRCAARVGPAGCPGGGS